MYFQFSVDQTLSLTVIWSVDPSLPTLACSDQTDLVPPEETVVYKINSAATADPAAVAAAA